MQEGSELMTGPKDGYDRLAMLRDQNRKQQRTFAAFSDYVEKKARTQGVPISGQFELTPLCNLDCRMCYVHLLPEQMKEYHLLSIEDWKSLIHDAWKAGMYKANLTGGECLTYPGFKDIYLYLQSLGCRVGVLSNGVLLDEKWVDFFLEHRPLGIQISLYGADEETYERVTGHRCFHTVLQNIQRINQAGLPLQICITPNRYMGEDVFDVIKLAKENTSYSFINSGLFDAREETGRKGHLDDITSEFYARIYRYQEELDGKELIPVSEEKLPAPCGPNTLCHECGITCAGGRSSFHIDWHGIMTPCNRLPIRSNPLETGFAEAWKQLNTAVSEWPRVPECQGCAYEDVCDNCAGRQLLYAKPGEVPTVLCKETVYFASQGIVSAPNCD